MKFWAPKCFNVRQNSTQLWGPSHGEVARRQQLNTNVNLHRMWTFLFKNLNAMPGSSSRREDLWWRLVMRQSYPTRQTCTGVLSVVSADCWLFPSHFQPPSNSGVHSSQRSFSEKIRNVINFVYCQSIKLCTSSYSDSVRSVRAMSVMKFDKPCREPYCVGLTNTPRKRDSQSCRLESRHSLASVQGAAGVEG